MERIAKHEKLEITKDGMDSTGKIAGSVTGSRHYDQLNMIMLNGMTVRIMATRNTM